MERLYTVKIKAPSGEQKLQYGSTIGEPKIGGEGIYIQDHGLPGVRREGSDQ